MNSTLSFRHYYLRRKKTQTGKKMLLSWQQLSVNDCVLNKHSECDIRPGSNYEPSPIVSCRHSLSCPFFSLSNYLAYFQTFFCGSHPDCSSHGNLWALERAKENVVQHFEAVGVLEQYNASLNLFQAKLPSFFQGLPQKTGENIIVASHCL